MYVKIETTMFSGDNFLFVFIFLLSFDTNLSAELIFFHLAALPEEAVLYGLFVLFFLESGSEKDCCNEGPWCWQIFCYTLSHFRTLRGQRNECRTGD